ncbi:hypothetical protein [Geminocystis sp.]|uniref:hypothetical protein n=1 Tax=Geminocystis sp. TaxID=2664100 RepID=UPI003593E88A
MKKTTSNEDEELVDFLKTYCPKTPKETKPCEELIMRVIATPLIYSSHKARFRSSLRFLSWGWLLPSTLITSLLIISAYVFNVNQKSSPQIATKTEDLETFMVNSWYGSMAQEIEFQYVTTVGDENN